jgi:putative NADH-flavin reductase
VRVAVTGAFGFSGKHIARRLLALRHEVITLTNSPDRPNPFGGSIRAFPYNFSQPHELTKSLLGTDVLMNTYWVRFDNPPHFTFAQPSQIRKFFSTLPNAQVFIASCTSVLRTPIPTRFFRNSAARPR